MTTRGHNGSATSNQTDESSDKRKQTLLEMQGPETAAQKDERLRKRGLKDIANRAAEQREARISSERLAIEQPDCED